MSVTATSAAATQTAAAAAAAKAEAAAASENPKTPVDLASDFDTFLQLLTTQLRNQDPEEPVDSTQYVSQLASFSAVEQQVRTNAKLDALAEAMTNGANGGLSRWIGVEVEAPTAAQFDGDPVGIRVTPPEGADFATLTVAGADGDVAAQIRVDPAATTLEWDGSKVGGGTADPGLYRFAVTYSKAGEELPASPGRVFAPVAEARLEDGKTMLVLADGTRLPAEEVEAVRGKG